jgi:hypothetical protein
MDARQQRRMVIAATCKLRRVNSELWTVPSQTSATATYRVNLQTKTCTCLDHTEGGFVCKHVFAAEFTAKRELGSDGTVTETRTVTFTEHKTYKQDWPAYNLAQATEKRRFRVLLQDLCSNLPERDRSHKRPAPKPHLTKDCVFAMAYKVYCGLSSRRFSTDLLEAYEKGFTSRPIPGAKVTSFFEDAYYTPVLKELVSYSARPLRAVETDFAIDSSGFGTSRYEKWYDEKYGVTRTKCVWIKTQIACGVKTNVVTAVRILDKGAADCPQFVPLVKETRQGFEIKEVSADKAYLSLENFEEVAASGAQAFIAFKGNSTDGVGGMFEEAFHYFQFKQKEYLDHYHKRSNVESTFSAVKRKFGSSVMSTGNVGMVNEVLCKLPCHNLTCLIQEEETLGISPIFWKDEEQHHPILLSMNR